MEVVEIEHRTAGPALFLFKSRIHLLTVQNLFPAGMIRHTTEITTQRGLKHVAAGIRQIIGQLHLVTQIPVTGSDIVAPDRINGTICQMIVGRFFLPQSFEILVTQTVVQRQLTLSLVPLAIYRIVTVTGRQRLSKRTPQGIAVVRPSGDDVDDIGYAVPIADTGTVDKFNRTHALGIKRQHLRLARYDIINTDLHAAPLVNGRYTMPHLIHTDIGKGKLLKQTIPRTRSSFLPTGRIKPHSVCLINNPVCLDLHLIQLDSSFGILRKYRKGHQPYDAPDNGVPDNPPENGYRRQSVPNDLMKK